MEAGTRTLSLRDAKASTSAVVEAAVQGEATTIIRHERPVAVIMTVEDARRFYSIDKPSYVALLTSIPVDIEFERDPCPLRVPDL